MAARRPSALVAILAAVCAVTFTLTTLQVGPRMAAAGEPFFVTHQQKSGDLLLSWPSAGPNLRYQVAREAGQDREFDKPTPALGRKFKKSDASGETVYVQAVAKDGTVVEQVYLSVSQAAGGAPASAYQVSQSAGLRLDWQAPGAIAEVHVGTDPPAVTAEQQFTLGSYADTGIDVSVDLRRADAAPATLGFGIAPALLAPSGVSIQGFFQTGDRVWSMIRYSTFIPSEYVTVPANGAGCAGVYHGGDNRTFGFEGSARTRVEVKGTWLDANANYTTSLSLRVATGISRAYDSNYNLIQTRQAGTDGAYFETFANSYDGKYVTGKVKHSIGNPNCTSIGPNIDYSFTFTLYRNGSYYLSGEHDQAPSHEAYVMQAYHPSNYLSKPLYTFAFGGNFNYLFAPAPNKTFNVSGSGPFTSGPIT